MSVPDIAEAGRLVKAPGGNASSGLRVALRRMLPSTRASRLTTPKLGYRGIEKNFYEERKISAFARIEKFQEKERKLLHKLAVQRARIDARLKAQEAKRRENGLRQQIADQKRMIAKLRRSQPRAQSVHMAHAGGQVEMMPRQPQPRIRVSRQSDVEGRTQSSGEAGEIQWRQEPQAGERARLATPSASNPQLTSQAQNDIFGTRRTAPRAAAPQPVVPSKPEKPGFFDHLKRALPGFG